MFALTLVAATILLAEGSTPNSDEPRRIADRAVESIGGEKAILRLFRIKERLNVSSDPNKPGKERTSILEPPKHWWLGKTDRVVSEKEPATFLVWAWTLGALVDPESKLTAIPSITDEGRKLLGLRVEGTIQPAMDLYFDAVDHRLARIDWRSDIHRFSDWRSVSGVHYPARCVGTKKNSGKRWYDTEILELERLESLPPGLSR
ncbi:MAG: hypothetical protein SFX72_08690 [Isosphaeraceae bacterium]|nr:hypothetical protein [Isosphaeraceae bacterium]